jgi:23S rRNA (cytidine1920-2'-O)/16S rRNA (cytidine1409-2'-O)-methyltransferase
MERTNFRFMKPEGLPGPQPSFASIDVSFISLKLILPPLKALLAEQGQIVALIKPQFEAGREKVPKTGVVREPAVHTEVLQTTLGFAAEAGYVLKGLTFSPIRGGEGNVEFLAYFLCNTDQPAPSPELTEQWIREAVGEAQKLQNSSG